MEKPNTSANSTLKNSTPNYTKSVQNFGKTDQSDKNRFKSASAIQSKDSDSETDYTESKNTTRMNSSSSETKTPNKSDSYKTDRKTTDSKTRPATSDYSQDLTDREVSARSDVSDSSDESSEESRDDSAAESDSSGNAEQWMSGIVDRAMGLEKRVQTFVTSRPVTVLLGAIAVGFVANRIMAATAESKTAAKGARK